MSGSISARLTNPNYTPIYTLGPNQDLYTSDLQFTPKYAIVDNPTNFWLTFPQISRVVEPGRLRVILRIVGVSQNVEFRSDIFPPGYPIPVTPLGSITIIFTDDEALTESAGSATPGTQIARGYYYDRNPLKVLRRYYSGNIAPHGTTTRWTYTCPDNRKAYIDNIFVKCLRQTVATAVGMVEAIVFYAAVGGTTGSLARVSEIINTVGTAKDLVTGLAGLMLPGDQLQGVTDDASTGGTYLIEVSANITEFDA